MKYLWTISGIVSIGYLGGLANALVIPATKGTDLQQGILPVMTDMVPQTSEPAAIMILGAGLIAIAALLKNLSHK